MSTFASQLLLASLVTGAGALVIDRIRSNPMRRTCPKHGPDCNDCAWWDGLIASREDS